MADSSLSRSEFNPLLMERSDSNSWPRRDDGVGLEVAQERGEELEEDLLEDDPERMREASSARRSRGERNGDDAADDGSSESSSATMEAVSTVEDASRSVKEEDSCCLPVRRENGGVVYCRSPFATHV